jgi:hypothetical protein
MVLGALLYCVKAIVASIVGVGVAGPVSGGLFASVQTGAAVGGGLAAGGFWAMLQSFLMT